jgi:hypothetical protein
MGPIRSKSRKPKLLLEIADLSRKSRLADAQTHCRLGNRAKLGDSNKRSQALEVHTLAYLKIAECIRTIIALDGGQFGHNLRSNVRQAAWPVQACGP